MRKFYYVLRHLYIYETITMIKDVFITLKANASLLFSF